MIRNVIQTTTAWFYSTSCYRTSWQWILEERVPISNNFRYTWKIMCKCRVRWWCCSSRQRGKANVWSLIHREAVVCYTRSTIWTLNTNGFWITRRNINICRYFEWRTSWYHEITWSISRKTPWCQDATWCDRTEWIWVLEEKFPISNNFRCAWKIIC